MKYNRNLFSIFALVSCLVLTACNSSDSSEDSGGSDLLNNITDIFSNSANVLTVKDSYVQACSTATLGEMADAFMSDPQWRDFQGTSGKTIVELSGGISYDGMPADALIQFEISGGSFEAVYLGINSVDQNMFVLSALLNKMCAAA
jgi:ABC-type Fe3+-hydroxamate transport system substrate-binding protein